MKLDAVIYEHAAFLIGKSPWETSVDPELLETAHSRAHALYGHSPIVVGIDVYNVEAEAYGASTHKAAGNGIPSALHFLEASDEILELDPLDLTSGRIPMILEVGKRLAAKFPGTSVQIPMSGPFSLANTLMGMDNLLCEVMEDPDNLREALEFLADGQIRLCRAIRDAGLDVIIFESGTAPPLLSRKSFRSVELPVFKRLMKSCTEIMGHRLSCIVGGDTLPILDDVMETNPGYLIAPAETDREAFLRKMMEFPDTFVRVNMNPALFVGNDFTGIERELKELYRFASKRPNTSIGTSVLPYNARKEMVFYARGMLDALQSISVASA